MEREKVVGTVFNYVFGIWCVFDIFLRTAFEDKINGYLEGTILSQNADIDRYIDVAVLVILMILIVFLQRYTKNDLIILTLITLPIIIATLNSDNNHMISMILFVIGAKYADMEKIIRMYFGVLMIAIPIVIIFCIIGILPDYTMHRGGQIRHALGFEHPNRLGMRVFQLITCFCYVKKNDDSRWFKYITMLFAAWFVYKIPNSQTAYIGILILFMTIVIGDFYDRHGISKKRIMIIMSAASAIIVNMSVAASFFNPKANHMYNRIDKLMSNRFSFGYRMFKRYGITLWGQNVQTLVKDSRYVGVYRQWYLDNAYLSILLRFGIVVYVIFNVLWIAAIIYYIKNDNYTMVAILFTYSIYGIMTTGFYMMSHNIYLLTLANPIYQKQYKTDTEDHRRIRFVWEMPGRSRKFVL